MPRSAARPRVIDLRSVPAPPISEPARPVRKLKSLLHPVSLGILGGLLAVITIGVIIPSFPAKIVSPIAQTIQNNGTSGSGSGSNAKAAKPTDRLVINRLGTNAPVISVGLTSDGAVDTPKTLWQVGHYSKSTAVGLNGTAVIVGHSGAPGQIGVFEHIDRIQVGDIITYKHSDGSSISFRAVSSQAYPRNDATAQTLVAPTTNPSLNLISCYGSWDSSSQEYDQRWIVKATRID